jgi:hypothetical protein
MNCEKCGGRMRIERNIKINSKEFKMLYLCTCCGCESSETIKTN